MPLPELLPGDEPSTFRFCLEADHPAFRGHFPARPILAGVLQVDWAIRMGEACFGPFGAFQGLANLKFMRIIEPGEWVTLSLRYEALRQSLQFEFTGVEGRKSSGTVRFQGAP